MFDDPGLFKVFHSSLHHSESPQLVSATSPSLPFLFSFPPLRLSSCPQNTVFSAVFLFTSNSGTSSINCLLPPRLLSSYIGCSDTRFSRGTTLLMSWPCGVRYFCLLQCLVVFFLLPFVSTLSFSQAGAVLSHLDSSMGRYSWFSLRNLCFHVTFSVSFLAFAATGTVFFLYNCGFFMLRLRSSDAEHLSFHFALSSYGLFMPLALWRLFESLRSLVQVLGKLPGFWDFLVFRHTPIPGKGRETTTAR